MAEGYRLRFIEQMPLGPADEWDRTQLVTAQEILDRLAAEVELVPVPAERRGSAPAEMWRVAGTDAEVGVIASVSRPFCGACDRVRLTAEGHVRDCLFAATETDLRTPMRAGADDDRARPALGRCGGGQAAPPGSAAGCSPSRTG